MKRSICTSGFKDWSVEQFVSWIKPFAFDGIELWIGHIERYQDEHGPLDKLKEMLDANGLDVAAISGYTTFTSGFSGEKDMMNERKSMRRLLDAARQLGCPLVRTFVGDKASRLVSPEQWGQAVAELRKMMLAAEQYEVNIAAEIHYDTYVDDIASALALMKAVNHPRLTLVFDGANLKVEQVDQFDALNKLYPYIQHVHLKNYRWDHERRYNTYPVPAFDGDIDNEKLLAELEQRGYDGFVSLEYFGESKMVHIQASVERWNELCGAGSVQ